MTTTDLLLFHLVPVSCCEVRMTNLEEAVLLTAKEAARFLHISLFTLNKIERQGSIVPFRTPGGHRRYSMAMLQEYLQTSRKSEPYRHAIAFM
jgi:hypothetical protein